MDTGHNEEETRANESWQAGWQGRPFSIGITRPNYKRTSTIQPAQPVFDIVLYIELEQKKLTLRRSYDAFQLFHQRLISKYVVLSGLCLTT